MKRSSGKTVRAAGILLMTDSRDRPEFLLLRHPNRWDLPKGHCDPGESWLQTALRETEEETGIAADDVRIDDRFEFEIAYGLPSEGTNTAVEKQVRYFLGYVSRKPPLNLTEHKEAKWFAWDPPHRIQAQTIDPLLDAVARHLQMNRRQAGDTADAES